MDDWITVEKVNSSDLSWMRWNKAGTLEVQFQNKDCTYTYTDVPKSYWNGLYSRNKKRDLKDSKTDKYSIGKYFNKTVLISVKNGIIKQGKPQGKECPKKRGK